MRSHYLHIAAAQCCFPNTQTYICPGIERKQPQLLFDWILGDKAPELWAKDFDQVLVRGNRFISEVAFFHRSSKTLLLVDLLENIGDNTPGVGFGIKFWWKLIFHMWNNPKPAPEYQLGWKDKKAAKQSLKRILAWDFNRIIIAHGDLIESNAVDIVKNAWHNLISD